MLALSEIAWRGKCAIIQESGDEVSGEEGSVARRRLSPEQNRLYIQRSVAGAILLTALMIVVGVLFGEEGTFDRMSCMLPIAFVLNFGLIYSIQFGCAMNRLE